MSLRSSISSVCRWIHAFLSSSRVFWFMSLSLVFLFAPIIDGSMRPAVRDFEVDYDKSYITQSSYVNEDGAEVLTDIAVLYGSMDKLRCKFSSTVGDGYSRSRERSDVGLNYMDRKSGDQTLDRLLGPQEFGPWIVTMVLRADIWGFNLTASHTCGIWPIKWTIYTKLGSIITVDKLRRVDVP